MLVRVSSAAVLGIQAVVRGGRVVTSPEPRSASSAPSYFTLPDAGPSLLSPDQSKALELTPVRTPAPPPAAPAPRSPATGPVDIEMAPGVPASTGSRPH